MAQAREEQLVKMTWHILFPFMPWSPENSDIHLMYSYKNYLTGKQPKKKKYLTPSYNYSNKHILPNK